MTPAEATQKMLLLFARERADISGIINGYEEELTTDAHNKTAYLVALRAWREDIETRLVRLEELAAQAATTTSEDP